MSKETLTPCERPTISGYTSRGCRCSACKKAYNDWRLTPKQKQRHADYISRPEVQARSRAYRQVRYNNPVIRSDIREYARKKAARLAQLVNGIKSERGCYDCGYNSNPLALQFDHVRGIKSDTIAYLVHKLSEKKLVEELAKCEVRCANCHLIKTHERRGVS